MPDLRKQIRDHYDAQSLPLEKVDAILAKGRAASAGEAEAKITPMPPAGGRNRWVLALAASIAILAAIAGFWLYSRTGADYADARRVVVAFFAVKQPAYSMMSPEPVKLREWALSHGAPDEFQIPAKLQNLPGKACTVLNVDGKPTFLLCFMTVDASGRQDGGMVHLLVARRSDFRHVPQSSTASNAAEGEWNFASWVDGDIVYAIAAPASLEKVRGYVFGPAASAGVSHRG